MKKKISNLLKELELTRKTYFNISPQTGKFLNLLIKDRKFKTILEIGTSNGYSGLWIAEALRGNEVNAHMSAKLSEAKTFSRTGGHLYTIESHEKDRYHLAKKTFSSSGLSAYITLILGHAPKAIPKEPKRLDMAFFDATKHEHIDYFKNIEHRIKKGGMIITDNAISHKKDLKEYFNNIKNNPNWKNHTLHLGSGLLISIKK